MIQYYGVMVEPATQEHCHAVAANLRPEDALEWAMYAKAFGVQHGTVYSAMCSGLDRGPALYVAGRNGEPLGVFGCVGCGSYGSNYGSPWLLATPAIARYPLATVKLARWAVRQWLSCWALLCNMVHKHHKAAIAYVLAAGFTLGAVPFAGTQFLPFFTSKEQTPCAHH